MVGEYKKNNNDSESMPKMKQILQTCTKVQWEELTNCLPPQETFVESSEWIDIQSLESVQTCAVCHIDVHKCNSFNYVDDDDETKKKLKICKNCHERNYTEIESIISLKKTEKWRGLNNDAKRTIQRRMKGSLYMHHKFLEKDFMNTARVGTIILKNANCQNSKAISFKSRQYTMANTCAFDSITQLLLYAARDKHIRDELRSSGTEYTSFLEALVEKGIKMYQEIHKG